MAVHKSEGGVLGDLFEPEEAAELKVKAALARRIRQAMDQRKLTQKQTAALTGLRQPDVSKIVNYKFAEMGIDRLFRALNRLGVDVQIALPDHPDGQPGRVEVVA